MLMLKGLSVVILVVNSTEDNSHTLCMSNCIKETLLAYMPCWKALNVSRSEVWRGQNQSRSKHGAIEQSFKGHANQNPE